MPDDIAKRALWAFKIAFKYQERGPAWVKANTPIELPPHVRIVSLNGDDLWIIVTSSEHSITALHADLASDVIFERDNAVLEGIVISALGKLCPLDLLANV
jgi:hypothetical protein